MSAKIRVAPTGGGTLAIEVVQPDRPFLFRTFLQVLEAEGLEPRRLAHPILGTKRKVSRITSEAAPARAGAPLPSAVRVRARLADAFREVARATDAFATFKKELSDAIRELDQAAAHLPRPRQARIREAAALLAWIYEENFVMLHASRDSRRGPILSIAKSDRETLVYRAGRMDEIAVARLDARGRTVGRRVFLGLFSDRAERSRKIDLPILRTKYEAIRRLLRLVPGSHNDHALRRLYEDYPLDLLFATAPGELVQEAALSLEGPGDAGVRIAFRRDPVRRGVACTVLLEEEAFRPLLADRISDLVRSRLPGGNPEASVRLDPTARTASIHLFFPTDRRLRSGDEARLRREIAALSRRWASRFEEALVSAQGEREGRRNALRYAAAFTEEYRVSTPPDLAVRDVLEAEVCRNEGRFHIAWGRPDASASYLKVFVPGGPRALSDLVPVLAHHGLRLLTEIYYPIVAGDTTLHMHILRVERERGGGPIAPEANARLLESLRPAFLRETVSDRLAALVQEPGFGTREVAFLRTLHAYVRQIGTVHTRRRINEVLLSHPGFLRDLLALVRARHDPSGKTRRPAAIQARLEAYLLGVTSIDDDRILRAFREVVDAIVRTNFFLGRPTLAFKVDATRLPSLPTPRPWREIFVSGPTVEGCHLRFGPIARGGIRASDRPDDFRTEILGLAATQTVKNAQIVPTGAKGGFVVRTKDTPLVAGYTTFIGALLDLADNIVAGRVVHPEGVVCLDGEDPYFVVAADKGTATFSDTANALAGARGFWMRDAFASGGSNGYDHKGLGITARGAWEAAKRHVAEAGRSWEGLRVAGIGDMSGDVFGNGMLLSPKMSLVAAFDHRHVFLDPGPDPAVSFRERARLFRIPRSSWDDYDRRKISNGGGVFSRTAKRISLSPAVRKAIGTELEAVDGEGLVRLVLTAPVDLLYNGGIGTYVKSEEESHGEVGDPANDAVRVDAEALRAKIAVEGGNLGFTPRARVAFAARGGRIHSDAMDNAAGVTLSDREVNIKILVGAHRERTGLVRRATKEVVAGVLSDTAGQFLALSLDRARAEGDLEPFLRLAADLERRGLFDRRRHHFPDAEEMAERRFRRQSLLLPELAVLFAHAKIDHVARLLESPLLAVPAMNAELVRYFPASIARPLGGATARHPLRAEIIATTLVNRITNRHGATFLHRMTTETGLAASRVTEGILVAERILRLDGIERSLCDAEAGIPAPEVRAARLALGETCEEVGIWLIREIGNLRKNLARLPKYDEILDGIRGGWRRVLPPAERASFRRDLEATKAKGFPGDLAERLVAVSYLRSYLDAVRIAETRGVPISRSARVLFEVGLHLSYPSLVARLVAVAARDAEARAAARLVTFDIRRARRRIVERLFQERTTLSAYLSERFRSLETVRTQIQEIEKGKRTDLSAFVALAHQIENLASV